MSLYISLLGTLTEPSLHKLLKSYSAIFIFTLGY